MYLGFSDIGAAQHDARVSRQHSSKQHLQHQNFLQQTMTHMNMHGTAASCKPGRIWLSSLRNNLACISIQLIHPATHGVVGRNTHCQHSI